MNIKFKIRFAAFILLLTSLSTFFLAGCGSSSSNGYYSGTWSGTVNNTALTATNFGMALFQSGSNIYGDFTATGTSTSFGGTVTGTANGNTLSITLTIPVGEQVNGVSVSTAATLTGTLTVSGTTATGSVSGTLNGTAATLTFGSLTVTQ